MNLTIEEYNAVMMAINEAREAIADDTFLDPYGENPEGYTNESLTDALKSAEGKIMANEGKFTCLTLMRDDFDSRGYDCSTLSDTDIDSIAGEIGENCMEMFWYSIAYFAGKHELPKLK